MGTWTFKNGVVVEEQAFNADLHCFACSLDGSYLGSVYPSTYKDMLFCISELNKGVDPITGCWEDGNGNVCTLNGWC